MKTYISNIKILGGVIAIVLWIPWESADSDLSIDMGPMLNLPAEKLSFPGIGDDGLSASSMCLGASQPLSGTDEPPLLFEELSSLHFQHHLSLPLSGITWINHF